MSHIPGSRAGPSGGACISGNSQAWPKHEVKALRQALKDVSSDLDKNERFRRISLIVGGGRSKKDCYDKYKALKAQAKTKRASAESSTSSATAIPKTKRPPFALDLSQTRPRAVTTDADVIVNERSVAGTRLPNGKRVDSSSSGVSLGERPREQQRRRSTASSSAFSSIASEPPEYFTADPRKPPDKMEVEEVDVEDFCLDEELEQHSTIPSNDGILGPGNRPSRDPDDGGGVRGTGTTERRGLTEAEGLQVRELIFGDSRKSFNEAWRDQGFYFCGGVDGLGYGLVQAEGGACGVLAAVQAFVLESLLLDEENRDCDWQNPGKSLRQRALVSALSTVIWRASDGTKAVLVLANGNSTIQRSSRYKPDGVTERLQLYEVKQKTALKRLLWGHLHCFTAEKGHGVILLVYSCLFTRGLANARADTDTGFGEPCTMMARHGYASQELINLLLMGRAHSNVFDGQRVIEENHSSGGVSSDKRGDGRKDDSNSVILMGAPERGRVGFLTLFEAYNHVEVGDRLKNPESSIWVVCSESHYSVLFSPDPGLVIHPREEHMDSSEKHEEVKTQRLEEEGSTGARDAGGKDVFELQYYDGLGRQDEVIRLTIDPTANERHPPQPTAEDAAREGMLVPPLDLVIRTRWPGARVDWNGTDPIL